MKILLIDSGCGLIPFIHEIIKTNKKNEYYLFMDHEYFPYGEKTSSQLYHRLKKIFKSFEKMSLDLVLICCNTLSKVYKSKPIKSSFKVKTILDTNLKHLNNKTILVTPLLKTYYKNDQRFISTDLASYIERNDTKKIILELKRIPRTERLILGCTHYPLVKSLMNHYHIKAISYENEFIDNLKQGSTLKFFAGEFERRLINKFFPNLFIENYSLT